MELKCRDCPFPVTIGSARMIWKVFQSAAIFQKLEEFYFFTRPAARLREMPDD
jgi:hypothetical protein